MNSGKQANKRTHSVRMEWMKVRLLSSWQTHKMFASIFFFGHFSAVHNDNNNNNGEKKELNWFRSICVFITKLICFIERRSMNRIIEFICLKQWNRIVWKMDILIFLVFIEPINTMAAYMYVIWVDWVYESVHCTLVYTQEAKME